MNTRTVLITVEVTISTDDDRALDPGDLYSDMVEYAREYIENQTAGEEEVCAGDLSGEHLSEEDEDDDDRVGVFCVGNVWEGKAA